MKKKKNSNEVQMYCHSSVYSHSVQLNERLLFSGTEMKQRGNKSHYETQRVLGNV